jgi:glycerophosphoryl diester phosphodiesterase
MRKSLLQNQSLTSWPAHRPLVIAHRGASGLAPENTLAAFKLAVAMGAEGIELDVHLSADGFPVVIHDRRINRTTNGIGQVRNFKAAELQKLDAGSWLARRVAFRPRMRKRLEQTVKENTRIFALPDKGAKAKRNLKIDFAGEGVPSLQEVFALLAPAKLSRIYVELKGEGERKDALLGATVALVRQFKLQKSVTLLSFDHQIIAEAKHLAPEIRTAATLPATPNALLTSRSMIQAVARASADEAALHYALATRRTVAALHKHGLEVSVWTANSKIIMRRLIACGVDAIMTNFPHRLIELFESSQPAKET